MTTNLNQSLQIINFRTMQANCARISKPSWNCYSHSPPTTIAKHWTMIKTITETNYKTLKMVCAAKLRQLCCHNRPTHPICHLLLHKGMQLPTRSMQARLSMLSMNGSEDSSRIMVAVQIWIWVIGRKCPQDNLWSNRIIGNWWRHCDKSVSIEGSFDTEWKQK